MIGHRAGQFEEQLPSALVSPTEASHKVGALTVEIRRGLPGFTLDIAFSVPHGLTVLFGPSGSGKSLTLQSIAGLFSLASGKIVLDDMVWHDSAAGIQLPPQRRHVGYVPQNYALFPHLSVEQNIAFGLKTRGRLARQRVGELIDLMQLDGLERQRPAQLSGGQQQRVALARALAADSRLLLLDEPFSSLDAAVREILREEMRAFHERVHVPIVLVTHDAIEARTLADTVVVIQQGRVLQVGTSDAVFRSPRTRAVAALVGMHTCWTGKVIDIVTAQHASTNASQAVALEVEGLSLYASIPATMPVHPGQTLEFGMRTDELRIFDHGTAGRMLEKTSESTMMVACAPGIVVRNQDRGTFHSITVRLETGQVLDIPMIARELHDLHIGVGSPVTLGIPAEAVHVFSFSVTA
jgi:ABC-type sulfate/molybdate transport systems ATPase subunit